MSSKFSASITLNLQENISKSSKRVAKSFDRITAAQKRNEKQLNSLSKANVKLGNSMTRVAQRTSLAFIGFSAISFKAASNAEETASKFNVVFGDIAQDANRMAKSFAKDFGLAESSAKELLSGTGDLLSGFGFTDKAAFDMSLKVNRLAADLASFSNIQGGAKRASEALTKGLLGERESMKLLGISIRESDITRELKSRGWSGLTGPQLQAAKAIITLELAKGQSAKSEGDRERTRNSAANQMRLVAENLKEFSEKFGTQVINPLMEGVLPAINEFLGDKEKVSELLENIKVASEKTATFVQLVYHGMKTITDFFGITGKEQRTQEGRRSGIEKLTGFNAFIDAISKIGIKEAELVPMSQKLDLNLRMSKDGSWTMNEVPVSEGLNNFSIDLGNMLPAGM